MTVDPAPVPLTHAVLLRGSRVLICFTERLTQEDRARIGERLEHRFPGVAFTLMGGVAALAVAPAEGDPTP